MLTLSDRDIYAVRHRFLAHSDAGDDDAHVSARGMLDHYAATILATLGDEPFDLIGASYGSLVAQVRNLPTSPTFHDLLSPHLISSARRMAPSSRSTLRTPHAPLAPRRAASSSSTPSLFGGGSARPHQCRRCSRATVGRTRARRRISSSRCDCSRSTAPSAAMRSSQSASPSWPACPMTRSASSSPRRPCHQTPHVKSFLSRRCASTGACRCATPHISSCTSPFHDLRSPSHLLGLPAGRLERWTHHHRSGRVDQAVHVNRRRARCAHRPR